MSEQKPNWVAKRAACKSNAVLKDLLKAVEQDVEAVNELPAEQRGHHKYKYNPQLTGASVSRTFEDGEPVPTDHNLNLQLSVVFKNDASGQGIKINQHFLKHSEDHVVTLIWDAENLSCQLIWDDHKDRPLEIWQVSQQALEPLFFSDNEE